MKEYKVISASELTGSPKSLESKLNEQAKEGWEIKHMTSIYGMNICVLSRSTKKTPAS